MKPTRISILLFTGIVVGVVAWAAVGAWYESLPPLPVYSPATLFMLAVAEGYFAYVVRGRVQRRTPGRPVAAMWVARAVALAKASALVGALAFGGYGGYLVYVTGDLTPPAHVHDAKVAGAGVGTALLLVIAALALERACRVPGPPEDDEPEDTDADWRSHG